MVYQCVFLMGLACALSVSLIPKIDDRQITKMSTKDLMEKAFGGKKPLMARLMSKRATNLEVEKAIKYLKAMAKNNPPSGTNQDWKIKNEKLIEAAIGIEKGEAKAFEKFAKAINCKACHEAHQ